MDEECERNVTTELTVGTTYSIASFLANTVIKTMFKRFVTSRHFNIENMQLVLLIFERLYR